MLLKKNEALNLTVPSQFENEPLTMSSREIAELTGKRHDHVMRDIDNMLKTLKEDAPKFGAVYFDAYGRETKCYNLPKRETLILVSGYSVELRARIIDRWQELEEKQAGMSVHELLSSPVHLLELAQGYAKQVIELTDENNSMRKDVDALDRISKADGSLCGTEAAKALQMRPKDLFAWLSQNGWFYKRTGSAHYLGYQSKVQTGLLEHKVTTVSRADGSEKITEQVRITPKGLKRLAQLIQPALKVVEPLH